MSRQIETCAAVAEILRKACAGMPGVVVELEDSCDPSAEIGKALGRWGVLVIVATGSQVRRPGSGALTDGAMSIDLTVIENPKRNRKSATPGPTVTSVAETARDALHWTRAGGFCLEYVDMQRADAAEDDFRIIVHFTAQPVEQNLPPTAYDAEAEPEEIIEGGLVDKLSAAMPGWAVCGALAANPGAGAIELPPTRIDVTVDVASQMMDWEEGLGLPRTYTARATLRVARADDRSGLIFRNAARQIRKTLAGCLGGGCAALNAKGFLCDAFVLDSTETAIDSAGEADASTKTYNATVTGRYIPPAE